MGAHIPGRPNIIVQNMPGAASLVAANYVYSVAPKDGTVIAAIDQYSALFQQLGGQGIHYDASKFAWLGSISYSNGVLFSWRGSGINSIDDAISRKSRAGATGNKDDSYIYARVVNSLLGAKFDVILGYNGTAAVSLAMETGEVDVVGRTYFGFVSAKPDWVRDGKINYLLQVGERRQAELPNLPTLGELVKSEQHRQIVQLINLPTGIGYAHWVSSDTPRDRQAILRKAYADTISDPALLEEARNTGIPVKYRASDDLTALVASARTIPEAILKQTASILQWE